MIDTYKKPQREGLETARCPTGVGSNPTRVYLLESRNGVNGFSEKN